MEVLGMIYELGKRREAPSAQWARPSPNSTLEEIKRLRQARAQLEDGKQECHN